MKNQAQTSITAGDGQFGNVKVLLAKSGEQFGHWPEVREMLNHYCGYKIKNDEILLFEINGEHYYITDITLRMLEPKELYAAMGFPPDYQFEKDYLGHDYPRVQQVAKCGNAVVPKQFYPIFKAIAEIEEGI